MLRGLGERGVDTSGVIVDRTVSTGISVIMSGEADRAILTMPGTVSTLRPDQVDPSLLERSRHVHVSAYFIQRSIRSGLTELFDDVHANGGTTSVDPNWDPEGSWDDGLLDLLLKTDVFLPNAIEAARIARTSSIDDAVRALCARASLVVVKDGDRGALLGGEGEWIRAPGFATDVVDTTGAGDAFDAGFLAAWLGDAPLTRALRIANACGSLSTRALGGVDAQVTMQEAVDAIERGSAA
jgi:sugar/nucleoside kinase (ribokinase family)